jgi:hypothetical protein
VRTLAICLVVLTTTSRAQDDAKPRLMPLFSNVERGPAFMLECRNTFAVPIPATELLLHLTYRVDGVDRHETGGRLGSFLGGEPILEPGQTWKIMLGFRQGTYGTMSADFGAVLRSPRMLPLTAGRHTVAVRCADSWSDDVEFYWESATVPD